MKLLAALAISQASASFYDALFADYNYELEFDLDIGNDCYAFAGFTEDMQITCHQILTTETKTKAKSKLVKRSKDTNVPSCFCKYNPSSVDADFEDPDADVVEQAFEFNSYSLQMGSKNEGIMFDPPSIAEPTLPTFDRSMLVGGHFGAMAMGDGFAMGPMSMKGLGDEEPVFDDSFFDEPVAVDAPVFVDPTVLKLEYISKFVKTGIVDFPLPTDIKSCYDHLKFPGNKAIKCNSKTYIGHKGKVCTCMNKKMMKNAKALSLVPDDAQDISDELKEFILEKSFITKRMVNLLDDKFIEPYEEPEPFEFEVHASFVADDTDKKPSYCKQQKKKPCKMLPKCTWANHKSTVESCSATCTDLLKNAKEIAGEQCRNLMVKIDEENNKELICQRSRKINYNLCFETLNNFIK